jgi:hypothetical protein
MESMCVATNTISFEQWLSPRVVFCGRQFHKLGGYHPFAALLQVLIASFTKILSAVPAQTESEQTGGTKHCYPVVAACRPQYLNCAADSPRDESVRRRTRLPLQSCQFFVYLGERACSELFTNLVPINGSQRSCAHHNLLHVSPRASLFRCGDRTRLVQTRLTPQRRFPSTGD